MVELGCVLGRNVEALLPGVFRQTVSSGTDQGISVLTLSRFQERSEISIHLCMEPAALTFISTNAACQ